MRAVALFCAAALLSAQSSPDALLKAMKDEIERSRSLEISGLDKPYFIEYTVEDLHTYGISATLGGILARNSNHHRVPRARVRVGDYTFDNANYVYSDSGTVRAELPIDDNYSVLRRTFWLATDGAFKRGVEALTRKRAALKNMTQPEALADLWKVKPVEKVLPVKRSPISLDEWASKVKSMSTVFSSYPEVLASVVSFDASDATFYLANSEGSTLRLPDSISTLQVRASGQAPDGMTVRESANFSVLDLKTLPSDVELTKAADQVAARIKALIGGSGGRNVLRPSPF